LSYTPLLELKFIGELSKLSGEFLKFRGELSKLRGELLKFKGESLKFMDGYPCASKFAEPKTKIPMSIERIFDPFIKILLLIRSI
jgi:hypothetical protein